MNGVKFLITLMCFFTLSACTTTNFMWEKSVSKETITSFLITKDNENLIVIGEKHHYIFSVSDNLKKIFSSDKRKHLIPYFYYFKVDEKNNITGEYTLLSTTDKLQDNLWLKKAGFKKYTNNKNDNRYKYSGIIKGTRYLAKGNIPKRYKFNKPYTIEIEEPSTAIGNIGKILATPLTIAADGTIIVYALSVVLVGGLINPDFAK